MRRIVFIPKTLSTGTRRKSMESIATWFLEYTCNVPANSHLAAGPLTDGSAMRTLAESADVVRFPELVDPGEYPKLNPIGEMTASTQWFQ